MAANQGDLIQLVDVQTYLGQEVLNVYYYRYLLIAPATENYLETFTDAWKTTVLQPVLDIQASLLEHTELRVTNISNNLDIYTDDPNEFGDVVTTAAQALPSYMSVGFQLIRESLATRNGYKRFAGLNDATVDGNTISLGAALVTAVEDALAANILQGLIEAYEPVIYRKTGNPPVGTGYTYSSIGSAVFKGLGTQNTRKP